MTQKFKTKDVRWRTEVIKKIYLDGIQYIEVFVVADAKIRDTKIK